MLLERGHHPVAVTPDRLQARYVAQKYPDVPVINSKFEEILGDAHAGKFGTVITAESLQYLKLNRALPLIEQVLKPGGRWVACDYFYREPTHEKSCHHWDHFTTKLAEAGLRIVHRQDITANVLPTLRFAHMWATRFGVPAIRFAFFRFRKKQPGLHHLLHDVLALLEQWAGQGVSMVDAQRFEKKHQYMLVVVERAAVAERASSAPVLADTTFEFDLKPAKV